LFFWAYRAISNDDASFFNRIFTNPIVQAGLANPRVLEALKGLMEDPASATQYLSDPEIGPVLMEVYRTLGGQPGGIASPSPPNAQNDDDTPSST